MLRTGRYFQSIATGMNPVVPSADFRRIMAETRPNCRNCAVVSGAGYGRGIPGSAVYEARDIRVLVLSSRSFDNIVALVQTLGNVYFIPSRSSRPRVMLRAGGGKTNLQQGMGQQYPCFNRPDAFARVVSFTRAR